MDKNFKPEGVALVLLKRDIEDFLKSFPHLGKWLFAEVAILTGSAGVDSQPAVQADAKDLCNRCEEIGRTGEHSWFCRKCGEPLN